MDINEFISCDSVLNENIINNSNFENTRCRLFSSKIHVSDITIDGMFFYAISHSKKKINRTEHDNQDFEGGKLYFNYVETVNIFYLDNKLKVVNYITNRYIVIYKLKLESKTQFKIIRDENGLCLKLILDTFLSLTDSVMPVNVYTNDPIISEIFSYLICNHVDKDKHFKNIPSECFNKRLDTYQILVHYVKCEKNQHMLSNMKYPKKTHSCLFKSNKKTIYNNGYCCSVPYTFDDQNVMILDNNFNHQCPPTIFINIPPSAINKNYFKRKNQKIKKRKNIAICNSPFLNPDHVIHKNMEKMFQYFVRKKNT